MKKALFVAIALALSTSAITVPAQAHTLYDLVKDLRRAVGKSAHHLDPADGLHCYLTGFWKDGKPCQGDKKNKSKKSDAFLLHQALRCHHTDLWLDNSRCRPVGWKD